MEKDTSEKLDTKIILQSTPKSGVDYRGLCDYQKNDLSEISNSIYHNAQILEKKLVGENENVGILEHLEAATDPSLESSGNSSFDSKFKSSKNTLLHENIGERFSDRELLYAISNRYKRLPDEPAHRCTIRRKRILEQVKRNIKKIAETSPEKLRWCSYEDIGIIDYRKKALDFDHYADIDRDTGEIIIRSKFASEIAAIESRKQKHGL